MLGKRRWSQRDAREPAKLGGKEERVCLRGFFGAALGCFGA